MQPFGDTYFKPLGVPEAPIKHRLDVPELPVRKDHLPE